MKTAYRTLLSSLVAASALGAGAASAATTVETISAWNGSNAVTSWGIPDTRVYGQSVTAPAGATTLTGFSFRIQDTQLAIGYSANVHAWNGSSITGPALFSLTGQSFGGGGTSAFLPVSFSTSVPVTAGSQYMLFLSTIGDPGPGDQTGWGWLGSADVYSGGGFFFVNGNDPTALTQPWEQWLGNGKDDLAFTATFDGTTVVPVPGALGLMLSGAAALGFLARRRRNA